MNKFDIKGYWKPTPKIWRQIGDSILYGCGTIGAGGLIAFEQLQVIFSATELKVIIGVTLILGFVGKFLTNFFKKEDKTNTDAGN